MQLTDVTGLASVTLPIIALPLLLPRVARLAKARLAWVLAAVTLLALTPFRGLPLVGYVRGPVGDLSITSTLLAGIAIVGASCGWPAVDARNRLVLRWSLVVVALALYPMALGVGSFDPYRLGFGQPWFVAILFCAALTAWSFRQYVIASCITLAVLAWTVGWYESRNLWDYLIDPVVVVYAVVTLIGGRARQSPG
jgi:hypothetical protein